MARAGRIITKQLERPRGSRIVQFGDVVENVNTNIKDPLQQGIELYVGLDHLDPGSLRIERWGNVADGTTFTRRFLPGQVLFGKRRAYQRKAAVAEFEGICSGDILVFEAKGELIPGLLPYIVSSDSFFQHALRTSAGSLSPRTRWSDLAQYKFALPPKPEQHRIAGIMLASEAAKEVWLRVGRNLVAFQEALLTTAIDSKWRSVALQELLVDQQYGTSAQPSRKIPGGVPVIRIPNVLKGFLDLADLKWVELDSSDQAKFALSPGDVLLVRTNGNPNYVGRTAVVDAVPADAVFASYLIRLRPNPELVRPRFLSAMLNTPLLRRTLRREIRSSAGNFNINTRGIAKQEIPLPSLGEQDELLRRLDTLHQIHTLLLEHRELTNGLARAVFAQEMAEGRTRSGV